MWCYVQEGRCVAAVQPSAVYFFAGSSLNDIQMYILLYCTAAYRLSALSTDDACPALQHMWQCHACIKTQICCAFERMVYILSVLQLQLHYNQGFITVIQKV